MCPSNFYKGRDTHSHIDIKMAMSYLLSLINECRLKFLWLGTFMSFERVSVEIILLLYSRVNSKFIIILYN